MFRESHRIDAGQKPAEASVVAIEGEPVRRRGDAACHVATQRPDQNLAVLRVGLVRERRDRRCITAAGDKTDLLFRRAGSGLGRRGVTDGDGPWGRERRVPQRDPMMWTGATMDRVFVDATPERSQQSSAITTMRPVTIRFRRSSARRRLPG